MQHLAINSTLQSGKYRILSILGQGGFGITYLASQEMLDRKVAIKEFFIKELCERDENTSHVTFGTTGTKDMIQRFREKFLKEARNIAKLNHPNIVHIIDVFEENGTAYYVMEYEEGGSLDTKVKEQGALSESVALHYIQQVASALDYIHKQKMSHLDVKPANIMLDEDNNAILIDFGLSKQYDAITGNQTSTSPVGISSGYAPMEQYKQGGVGDFSPVTDIYSLGATFYKLITGKTPPEASIVFDEGLPELPIGISNRVKVAIMRAMKPKKKDRPQSIIEFLNLLNSTSNDISEQNGKALYCNSSDDESTQIINNSIQQKEPENALLKELASKDLKYIFALPTMSDEKMRSIRKNAEAGDAESLFFLGIMYIQGIEVFHNLDKGKNCIQQSAKLGDKRAQSILDVWADIQKKYGNTSLQKKTDVANSPNLQNSQNTIESKIDSKTNVDTKSSNTGCSKYLKLGVAALIAIAAMIGKGLKHASHEISENSDKISKNIVKAARHSSNNSSTINYQDDSDFSGFKEEHYEDGSSYKGNFRNGQYSGQGTLTTADFIYEGEWQDGEPYGYGKMTWINETREGYMIAYEGYYVNGQRNGKGTAYYVGGTYQTGQWKAGDLTNVEEEGTWK